MAGDIYAEQVNLTSAITTNPTNMYVESNNDKYIKKIAISDLVYTRDEVENKLNGKADKASHTNNTNTFTKITYNSQGIITGGAGLAADDIPGIPQSRVTDLVTALNGKQNLLGIDASSTDNTFLKKNGTWGTPPTYGGSERPADNGSTTVSGCNLSGNAEYWFTLNKGWYRAYLGAGGGGGIKYFGGVHNINTANGGDGGRINRKFYVPYDDVKGKLVSGAGGIVTSEGGMNGSAAWGGTGGDSTLSIPELGVSFIATGGTGGSATAGGVGANTMTNGIAGRNNVDGEPGGGGEGSAVPITNSENRNGGAGWARIYFISS